MAAGNMDEALKAFLLESTEGLARLEEDLVTLERTPSDAATLASVFRAVHTIKGTCGFFGFNRLEAFTHVAEDVLSLLRDGRVVLSRELMGAMFELVDATRDVLALIEETGSEGDKDHTALIATFSRLREGAREMQAAETASPAEEGERISTISDSAVRVDVQLLDKLINVVGELVLARNQILQYAETLADPVLQTVTQRLNLITGELQEGMMKTRMQPISVLWGAFPRLVRDLELQTGKKVRLEREGGDTELDRSLLQAIKDPLTHLVRNSIDHGLEVPAERLRLGKPETGLVLLRAYHESGYVIVEISDDGAGVNTKAVLLRAIERGLVRADQTQQLSERDILDFLFLPGFSTAAQVTNISGRGVGLDVVRNNVERVGGSVDIQTRPGYGTSFKVRIPLTLAIVPALVATCHDERYAIPQVNLLEVVRLESGDWQKKIEAVHSSRVFRLRGKLLPLVELRQILRLPERSADAALHILVLQADGREFGLVVDSVRDTEEIVVKPLGRHLKSVTCFAGATIMGDGRVALILDAVAIAQRAHVLTEAHQDGRRNLKQQSGPDARDKRVALLLFRIGEQGLGAIPLARVQRLEEIHASSIEYSGGEEVVQYRNEILPLMRLSRVLNARGHEAAGVDMMQVIVHRGDNGQIGLVVDHIIDIVDEELTTFQRQGVSRAIVGSAVIQGRVTDLIDLDHVVAMSQGILCAVPEQLAPAPGAANPERPHG